MIADVLSDAAVRAKQPVRVPRRVPLTAFGLAFLIALLPAYLLTSPFPGRVTAVATLGLAVVVGLAVAVLVTVRTYDA